MVHYTRQEESFFNLNNHLGLNIEFPMLPLTTPISVLLNHVAETIKEHGLVLLPPHDTGVQSSSFLSSASLLPLQLLSFTNMGRATSLSQTPRLQVAVIRADSTVHDLVTTYKKEFAPKVAVTHRRFLIINFGSSLKLLLDSVTMTYLIFSCEESSPGYHRRQDQPGRVWIGY